MHGNEDATLKPTLAAALWPRQAASRIARFAVLTIGGALALTVSAKIQVPFYPVPMTLQTLVILALSAAYGAQLAGATLLLYLAEGLAGLPVFAGAGAGPAYMMGPTGGYLAGFLIAAIFIGWLADRGWDRSAPRLIGAMSLGHIVIFAFGFAWLALLIGPEKAWTGGVVPFFAATIVKTLLAWAVVSAAWRGVEALNGRKA
jgi:biotin transport system substrate-specific component